MKKPPKSESKKDHQVNDSSNIKKNQYSIYQLIVDKFSKISHLTQTLLGTNQKSNLLNFLKKAIDNCQKNDVITLEEKKMISNIINIQDTKVGDVMSPRTDIVAIQYDYTLNEIKKLIIETEHSRIPVFKRNLDNIVGFIHSKDLAKFIGDDNQAKLDEFKINNIIRKILYVPHSMRIIDLLLKMRSSRVHIAIVLDEYGGTDGLVSIEDIMEEIVGEIEDEHDLPDDNIYLRIKQINDHLIQVGGRVEIEKITEFLNNCSIIDEISGEEFETVGGLMFLMFKKVPESGEIYKHHSGVVFKILDADARSVRLIEISKPKED